MEENVVLKKHVSRSETGYDPTGDNFGPKMIGTGFEPDQT